YLKRSDLLEQRATGIYPEVTPELQRIFDAGHAAEAAARPIAEKIIGDDLSPLVASAVVDGILLGASFDGITLDGKFTFEHKLINAELREALGRGEIPKAYWPQMEQGLLITGASLCLFMASDGTEENCLHAWYEPNLQLRQRLLRGWQTF
ncbi:hypothetical protein, partial [Staphylococcus aureus]|uniref:hypothetical protein n=1 Tax=Staphylococcus aureus TaxID=1280 RepID=UPI0039BE69F9